MKEIFDDVRFLNPGAILFARAKVGRVSPTSPAGCLDKAIGIRIGEGPEVILLPSSPPPLTPVKVCKWEVLKPRLTERKSP